MKDVGRGHSPSLPSQAWWRQTVSKVPMGCDGRRKGAQGAMMEETGLMSPSRPGGHRGMPQSGWCLTPRCQHMSGTQP